MDRKAGFTLVELMIVLAIIAIIAAFAIPNLMKSRMSANEAGAIGTLRTLVTAQSTYMNTYKSYGTFGQLKTENLIELAIVRGEKQGYYIGQISTGSNYAYCYAAIPVDDDRSGTREYITTQAGTVYEANLSSAKNSADDSSSSDQWWVPGTTTGVPGNICVTPEDMSGTWTPIGG